MKKAPGDIIILHMCSINDNHVIMVPQTWSTTDRIFCHFGLDFVLLPPNNPKNQDFTEMKKAPGDIIILQMCSINDNHVIMFPQTWSTTDRIFCHFGPFFVLLQKWKKDLQIIILHMCPINDNHMMYSSWNMECDGQNFLSFWTIFCPFTFLTTQKIKILQNWKKLLEILSFYTCVP